MRGRIDKVNHIDATLSCQIRECVSHRDADRGGASTRMCTDHHNGARRRTLGGS